MGNGPNTKDSDELAELLVATGTGKRAPANLSDFTTLEFWMPFLARMDPAGYFAEVESEAS